MYKETSQFYNNYLGKVKDFFGQQQIGTGRTATADQMYGASQGMLSPLLAYDLQRRQQQMQNALAWQQGHDQRQNQPSDFEKWTKGILGGAYLASSALTGGAGLMSMFKPTTPPTPTPLAGATGGGMVNNLGSMLGTPPASTYQSALIDPNASEEDFFLRFGKPAGV